VVPHTESLIDLIESKIPCPTNGAEIGVWYGETSRALLGSFPKLHLIMVDRYKTLTDEEAQICVSRGNKQVGRISQAEMYRAMEGAVRRTQSYYFRRTIMIGDSIQTSTLVKDSFLDFVFVDAHHSYESVRFDVQTWFPKVKPGGIVCGHDYDGRGDKHGRFGVKQAVDDFSKRKGYFVDTAPNHIWWIAK